MAIDFTCPGCRRRLRVPDDHAGRDSRCPRCGKPIRVPDGPEPEAAEEEAFDLPRRRGSRETPKDRQTVARGLGLMRFGTLLLAAGQVLLVLMLLASIMAQFSLQGILPEPGKPQRPVAELTPEQQAHVRSVNIAVMVILGLACLAGLTMFAGNLYRLIGQVWCLWAPEDAGLRGWAIALVASCVLSLLAGCAGGIATRVLPGVFDVIASLGTGLMQMSNEACLLVFLWQLAQQRGSDDLEAEVRTYGLLWLGITIGLALLWFGAGVVWGAMVLVFVRTAQVPDPWVTISAASVLGLATLASLTWLMIRYLMLLDLGISIAGRARARIGA